MIACFDLASYFVGNLIGLVLLIPPGIYLWRKTHG